MIEGVSFRELFPRRRDPDNPTIRDVIRALEVAGTDGCVICAALHDMHTPGTYVVTYTNGNTTRACPEHSAPEVWAPGPDGPPFRRPNRDVPDGEVTILPIAPERARVRFSLMKEERTGKLIGVQMLNYPYNDARARAIFDLEDWRQWVEQLADEPPRGWTAEDWIAALNAAVPRIEDQIREETKTVPPPKETSPPASYMSGRCTGCGSAAERGPSGSWWHRNQSQACNNAGATFLPHR